MATILNISTGKRKEAVARVSIEPGEGKILINKTPFESYFPREAWKMMVKQPFEAVGLAGKYNVTANVFGGGLTGQAGAVRHGISKALLALNPGLRERLKKEGLITRDPRTKERKKYGQKGARKKFQFSKR
ncbi:MAG: 30S ribosomal protein S9 [Nitrospirae bacterium]|nr:30S ribosomal protein S9 [Nitrospirota bacterium]MBI3605891.1 30S ribosomal protein S9 [Nitrospirota bacterium]